MQISNTDSYYLFLNTKKTGWMPAIHPVFFFYDKPGWGSFSLPFICSSIPEYE